MASTTNSSGIEDIEDVGTDDSDRVEVEIIEQAVANEHKYQPHLICLSDSPALLTGRWNRTTPYAAVQLPESITPTIQRRMALIYNHRMIRLSPHDPNSWIRRSGTLMSLGYAELCVADTYRARILCEAILCPNKEDSRGISLTTDVRIAIGAYLMGKGFSGHDYNEAIVKRAKWLDERACIFLSHGLLALKAQSDAFAVITKACLLYPESEDLNRLLQEVKVQKTELYHQYLSHGRRSEDVKPDLFKGWICRKAYPWIMRSEYEASNKATKKAKAKFDKASPCAIVENRADGKPGVFAQRDIRKGEVIVKDNTVLVFSNHSNGLTCSACGASMQSHSVSASCCKDRFCSTTCMEEAFNTYHKVLCGKYFSWLYEQLEGKVPTSNEVIPCIMVKVLAAAIQSNTKPLKVAGIAQLGVTYESSTISQFTLNDNVVAPTKIMQVLGIDIFADVRFDPWAIQTLFLVLQQNRKDCKGPSLSSNKIRLQSSISPLLSTFNHDCNPNVIGTGKLGPITTVAFRDIRQGEEITVTLEDPRTLEIVRRGQLIYHLGKVCECARCKQERAFAAGEEGVKAFDVESLKRALLKLDK